MHPIANAIGAPADTSIVNPLTERFDTIQRQLKQSTETLDAIHQQLSNPAEGKALDERINQVAQLTLHVVATLGQTDSRLGEFADRLADTQAKCDHLKNKTNLSIVIVQRCVVLLIAWMAVGQISLCRNSYRNLS